MSYVVEVTWKFKAQQGLVSPVRAAKGLSPVAPSDGFSVVLRVGTSFADYQLNERGWFVDTDALEGKLKAVADRLASNKWTELFDFRPTFEHVARWAFEQLQPEIARLEYVTLENTTLGVNTTYRRPSGD